MNILYVNQREIAGVHPNDKSVRIFLFQSITNIYLKVTSFIFKAFYLIEKEFSTVSVQVVVLVQVRGLGSDMATTCHIAVLRCPESKATALGHFDGSSTLQGVKDMVKFVSDLSDQTCGNCKLNSNSNQLH